MSNISKMVILWGRQLTISSVEQRKCWYFICLVRKIFTAIRLHRLLQKKAMVCTQCWKGLCTLFSTDWRRPAISATTHSRLAGAEQEGIIIWRMQGRHIIRKSLLIMILLQAVSTKFLTESRVIIYEACAIEQRN